MYFINLTNENKEVLSSELSNNNITLDDINLIYKDKKNTLLELTINVVSVANTISKDSLDDFYDVLGMISNSFEDVDAIFGSISTLKEYIDIISSLLKDSEKNIDIIKEKIFKYNEEAESLNALITDYESHISVILSFALTTFNAVFEKDLAKEIKKETSKNLMQESKLRKDLSNTMDKVSKDIISEKNYVKPVKELSITSDNNALVVSETNQVAFLPYYISDVHELFNNSSKYDSIEDVVSDNYVLPLKRFKNSTIARFRESFNLIRKKEHGSISSAIDLGLELMFKYDLNPVIIAACRNQDELDIYLDYLDEGQTDLFDCFKIDFKYSPTIVKNKREDYYAS